MTDLEKMAAGELYWGFNPVFVPALERGQDYCHRYNLLPPSEKAARNNPLKEFFKKLGNQVIVNPPMHIDLGNLEVGDHTIINFNFVALDEALVSIGEHCFIGPNCSIYTVTHSLCYQDRDLGLMTALPVSIEDHCWLCGNVTVLPGVTIGKGSVIGAGSLVTKDIPAGVLAYGNPCRVIRPITENDREFLEGINKPTELT